MDNDQEVEHSLMPFLGDLNEEIIRWLQDKEILKEDQDIL